MRPIHNHNLDLKIVYSSEWKGKHERESLLLSLVFQNCIDLDFFFYV